MIRIDAEAFLARQCLTAQCSGETCGNDGQCRPVDRPALGPYIPLDAAIDRGAPSDPPADATAEPIPPTTDVADAAARIDAMVRWREGPITPRRGRSRSG